MRRINVRQNNGRCLVRFAHQGTTYSLTLGNYSSKSDRLKAERVALEVVESIRTQDGDGENALRTERCTGTWSLNFPSKIANPKDMLRDPQREQPLGEGVFTIANYGPGRNGNFSTSP